MTQPCKDPDELSNGDLLEVVRSIQKTLWPDGSAPPDRDPLRSVEGILRDAGLGPMTPEETPAERATFGDTVICLVKGVERRGVLRAHFLLKHSPTPDFLHHDTPVVGMANMMWWRVWADVAEENGVNLSGQRIDKIAPPTPAEAFAMAERMLGRIEQANDASWPVMLAAAWKADCAARPSRAAHGFDPTYDDPPDEQYNGEYAERFGECLAYMAAGDGVSWYDDHAEFSLGSELLDDVHEFDVPYLDCGESHVELEPLALASLPKKGRKHG